MSIEPNVYVFVHPAYTDQIAYTQTTLVWDSFQVAGATVLYGEAFRSANPTPIDQLVCYGRPDAYFAFVARFSQQNRWNYVVDESNSTSKPYDRALSAMAQYDAKNIIVTYQNNEHLDKLTRLGIRYLIMPQCIPSIRPKQPKSTGVLLSGQVHATFYPVRTVATRALQKLHPSHVHSLPTPGQDISTASHKTIREDYYKLLDTCKMAVVCRAGNRDRMVGKYVEFGASHVLPIGDCPTYMPDEMKNAMINVENMSDEAILAEVSRVLSSPEELNERVSAYVGAVEKHYTALPNMQRVVSSLQQHGRT